jgi:hypothetical protein
LKQLDDALSKLRKCMFDGIGDEEHIISEFSQERARRALEELDARLMPVPLCSLLHAKSDVVAGAGPHLRIEVEDQRLIQFQQHAQLRRHTDFPLVDASSSIIKCIPGWNRTQAYDAACSLNTSPSAPLVPGLLQAMGSRVPSVYGPRRREASTWRQKHKR